MILRFSHSFQGYSLTQLIYVSKHVTLARITVISSGLPPENKHIHTKEYFQGRFMQSLGKIAFFRDNCKKMCRNREHMVK